MSNDASTTGVLLDELRWVFRIVMGAGAVVGGSTFISPSPAATSQQGLSALMTHMAAEGHPVIVERVTGLKEQLHDINEKLDELIRIQQQMSHTTRGATNE